MKKYVHFWLLPGIILTAFTMNKMTQKKKAVLNHVALSVVSLQKSTAFYTDIIQLDSMAEPFKDGKHSWFKIAEHSQLHIIEASEGIRSHDKSSHLCFSVPSLED